MPLIEEQVDLPVWMDGSTIERTRTAFPVRVHLRDHLYCAWRPQSSRKVEQVNGLLKYHLAKLAQETHLPWSKLMPLALLHSGETPWAS
jgi:hypothetical protein